MLVLLSIQYISCFHEFHININHNPSVPQVFGFFIKNWISRLMNHPPIHYIFRKYPTSPPPPSTIKIPLLFLSTRENQNLFFGAILPNFPEKALFCILSEGTNESCEKGILKIWAKFLNYACVAVRLLVMLYATTLQLDYRRTKSNIVFQEIACTC